MKIYFPFNGLDKTFSNEETRQLMSPIIMNVRGKDVVEDRVRGGQRPGLDKFSSTQIGSEPILLMRQINTTYLSPEA
jgi:hypothetical protein